MLRERETQSGHVQAVEFSFAYQAIRISTGKPHLYKEYSQDKEILS